MSDGGSVAYMHLIPRTSLWNLIEPWEGGKKTRRSDVSWTLQTPLLFGSLRVADKQKGSTWGVGNGGKWEEGEWWSKQAAPLTFISKKVCVCAYVRVYACQQSQKTAFDDDMEEGWKK